MKKFINLMLACILVVGLAACDVTAEPTTVANETVATENVANETMVTEPAEGPIDKPEVGVELLRLSEDNIPSYLGIEVTFPSGWMWCLGRGGSNNWEELASIKPEEGFWVKVDPNQKFQTSAIRYVLDWSGTQDPDPWRESEIPSTSWEMSYWGVALPTIQDGLGLVFLIDPEVPTPEIETYDEILRMCYGEEDWPEEGLIYAAPYGMVPVR